MSAERSAAKVLRHPCGCPVGAPRPDCNGDVLPDEERAHVAADNTEIRRFNVDWNSEGLAARDHPEDTCEECGGANVVWFAPNDLWNRVMRGGDRGAPDLLGIVCPVCFIRRAEAAGVEATGWLVQPEVIHAD